MTDDKITPLPVKFKERDAGERMLVVTAGKCLHGLYSIDETLLHVECRKCGERIDPMTVLVEMANHESMWSETGQRFQEEMKRLAERSRTKCERCGHMTGISSR